MPTRACSASTWIPASTGRRVVVLTAKDLPGDNIVSLIKDDQPILVDDEIRHHAEPVALLAAPDRETLREAKQPHQPCEPSRCRPYSTRSQATQEFAHFAMDKGDVDAAFAEADLVIEGTYRVGHQEQLYIENNAMIAVPRAGRRRDDPRLDAVPVLHPQGAQARARA